MANDQVGAILLLQPDPKQGAKTYYTYNSLDAALDGIKSIFEAKLRELNPYLKMITYDIADFNRYVDGLPDLSMLVYEPNSRTFKPYGKVAIKSFIYQKIYKRT